MEHLLVMRHPFIMGRTIFVAALCGALVSCATPETRVRSALLDAGLSEPVAACMADRMVDRLSLGQLSKLRGLGQLRKDDLMEISLRTFLRRTRSLQDPEILGVVTTAAARCTLLR